jgi:ATP-dependent protease Clp ATPase subunit
MIIGQEKLNNEVSRIFDIFKSSKGVIRPHYILAGPSGSGKTYITKELCASKRIPYVDINAAQITKEGTSGNSLSKALSPVSKMGGNPAVVFVDEWDKLYISGNNNDSSANEVTIGVQNEFLKVLESPTTQVFADYGKYQEVDISKTLFVFAGAFNNEADVTIDKLRKYGVKTEFLGRVGLIYNTVTLSLEDLYAILHHSELLKHYLELFDDVKKPKVVGKIKQFLEINYKHNTVGARTINTLIHQYFIKGGKIGFEDVKDITFQDKLEF